MDIVTQEAQQKPLGKRPIGLKWRSSYRFTTLVVGSGIANDLLVYSIITPVIPFQLQSLGYTGASALTGWLLFAYSGGLLVSTMPIAMLSEGYNARRWPLIIGFVILIGSQIMFMEAPSYAVMCVARVIQGIGSSIVWAVGLALLCDATPEHLVAQQLGIAMIGFSAGMVFGPPVGGALYTRFGFRGPFIFGIIFSVVDLLGRLAIIERKDSLKWGYDPHSSSPRLVVSSAIEAELESGTAVTPGESIAMEPVANKSEVSSPSAAGVVSEKEGGSPPVRRLSFPAVLLKLSTSPRAMAASTISLIYGIIVGSQEPSIPVHLQDVWGLSSSKVGLVFIASVVPTLLSTPLTGYLADQRGAEWVALLSLILGLPWFIVMMVESRLALFVAAFGLSSFFTAGSLSPVTAELAAVSRSVEGLGYAHVYGAFNFAYGAGSTIGPVIGGQLYAHLEHGWQAITLLSAGIVGLAAVVSFCLIGERPLFRRIWKHFRLGTALK